MLEILYFHCNLECQGISKRTDKDRENSPNVNHGTLHKLGDVILNNILAGGVHMERNDNSKNRVKKSTDNGGLKKNKRNGSSKSVSRKSKGLLSRVDCGIKKKRKSVAKISLIVSCMLLHMTGF